MALKRRELLALGGAAAGFAALSGGAYALWPQPKLSFEAVSDPAGFRRIAGQNAGFSSFVTGVEQSNAAPLTRGQLCQITFDGQQRAGALVIASFSDFFCPYCRVLDEQVLDIVADDPRLMLINHQVPLLGRASEMAARAAIAAQKQGAYAAFAKRLIRTTFVPTPAYLRDLAQGEGIDMERFTADLTSPETNQKLAASLAAFRAFGFIGTPALVVGRTLVNGVISPRELRALCADELASTAPLSCA